MNGNFEYIFLHNYKDMPYLHEYKLHNLKSFDILCHNNKFKNIRPSKLTLLYDIISNVKHYEKQFGLLLNRISKLYSMHAFRCSRIQFLNLLYEKVFLCFDTIPTFVDIDPLFTKHHTVSIKINETSKNLLSFMMTRNNIPVLHIRDYIDLSDIANICNLFYFVYTQNDLIISNQHMHINGHLVIYKQYLSKRLVNFKDVCNSTILNLKNVTKSYIETYQTQRLFIVKLNKGYESYILDIDELYALRRVQVNFLQNMTIFDIIYNIPHSKLLIICPKRICIHTSNSKCNISDSVVFIMNVFDFKNNSFNMFFDVIIINTGPVDIELYNKCRKISRVCYFNNTNSLTKFKLDTCRFFNTKNYFQLSNIFKTNLDTYLRNILYTTHTLKKFKVDVIYVEDILQNEISIKIVEYICDSGMFSFLTNSFFITLLMLICNFSFKNIDDIYIAITCIFKKKSNYIKKSNKRIRVFKSNCVVCCGIENNIVLYCGHVVCISCVNETIYNDTVVNIYKCPICRMCNKVPINVFKRFSKDIVLKRFQVNINKIKNKIDFVQKYISGHDISLGTLVIITSYNTYMKELYCNNTQNIKYSLDEIDMDTEVIILNHMQLKNSIVYVKKIHNIILTDLSNIKPCTIYETIGNVFYNDTCEYEVSLLLYKDTFEDFYYSYMKNDNKLLTISFFNELLSFYRIINKK